MELNEYFQSYNDYFWQWEEEGKVIAIPEDNTIAYREYIIEILERLSIQGLPHFGAVLLVIIATNPNSNQSLDAIYVTLLRALKEESNETLTEAIAFLKLLTEVPKEYKSGKNRILLLQAVFENGHNILSLKKSKTVLDNYIHNRHGKAQILVKLPFSRVCLYRDMRPLSLLHTKFKSVNDILEKIASLPEIPETLNLEEDTTNKDIADKELVDRLIENNNTFHVGSLVKRIWSGLNIPVHAKLPSAQPLGGVSDLTNKGDFDKLLISEFANDDLVFLSRLANNEALYILREIPPATNTITRVILIDVSLKNWGTPKTVAFAIAVAIATHPKTTIPCAVYAIGRSFRQVSINSVDDIIDGLQILDSGLHAAEGIEAYFTEFPPHSSREVFLITEPATLKHAAMLKAVNQYQAAIHYWIYNDHEGNVDVYKKQQSSKKHLQHILLPLQELWKRETKVKKVPLRNSEAAYPILFRKAMSSKSIISTSDRQIFEVTNHKTVLRHYDITATNRYEKGWELVYKELPIKAEQYEMGLMDSREYVLLMFNTSKREITLVNMTSGKTQTLMFGAWRSNVRSRFIFYENEFHFVEYQSVWSINPVTGVIREAPKNYIAIYEQRQEEINTHTAGYFGSTGLFKNVTQIYINEYNCLVFNKHELALSAQHHIFLSRNRSAIKKVSASLISDKEFCFEDGSSIEIHFCGMLTLKSSKESIPYIYVPSVISSSLGVATDTAFAGNEYYCKEPLYELILKDAGVKKLEVIRITKTALNNKLSEGKEMIDTPGSLIVSYYPKAKAISLKKDLEQAGATIEMNCVSITEEEQQKLSPELFFKTYINEFIQTILTHGAKR